MAYESTPGTIPHRVIEHLKAMAEGSEASTTELAIALGWDDARGLKSWLVPAVEGGALAVRVGGARQSFYRLGDGKPIHEKDDDDPQVSRIPASALNSVFAYAEQRDAAPFSTALSSDGRLIIQRNGRVIAELTPQEAGRHLTFLALSKEFRERKRRAAMISNEALQGLLFSRGDGGLEMAE